MRVVHFLESGFLGLSLYFAYAFILRGSVTVRAAGRRQFSEILLNRADLALHKSVEASQSNFQTQRNHQEPEADPSRALNLPLRLLPPTKLPVTAAAFRSPSDGCPEGMNGKTVIKLSCESPANCDTAWR